MRKNPKKYFNYLLLISAVILFVVAFCVDSNTTHRPPGTGVDFSDGWYQHTQTGEKIPVSYPLVFDSETMVISVTLPDVYDDTILQLKCNYKWMQAEVDGSIIYESDLASLGNIRTDTGHYVALIPLSSEHSGKEIRITVAERESGYNTQIKFARLTTVSDYGFDLFVDKVDYLIVGLTMTAMGFAAAVIWIVFKQRLANERIHMSYVLLWISLFSSAMGVWILTEPHFVGIVTGRFALSGMFNYLSLMLLPVCILGILSSVFQKKEPFIESAQCLASLFFAGEVVLFLFFGVDLSDMLIFIHGTVLCAVFIFFGFFVCKSKAFLDGTIMKVGVAIALVMSLISIYYYCIGEDFMVYAIVGVIAFVISLMAHGLLDLLHSLDQVKLYLQYKEFAMKDALTGLGSRLAYSRFSGKYQQTVSSDLALLFFDIDGLKNINDNYGHFVGDDVIATVASFLLEAFGEDAECFRMGGDEFLVALQAEQEAVEERYRHFMHILESWNGEYIRQISVSCGMAYARQNPDASFEDLIKLADYNMYLKKNKQKSASRVSG